jgi:acyl-CoA reductase-like NAD-dependent aldehyde dehydrogenase
MKDIRIFLGGEWVNGAASYVLVDKYDGHDVGTVHTPDAHQLELAVVGLARGQQQATLTAFERSTVLNRAAEIMAQRSGDFVDTIVADSGFTVVDAQREVSRAVETLHLCAEEAKRLTGHMVPIEGAPGISGRIGFTLRKPLGVVCAITPFNSPLNTVCHKIGPALGAGNAVVLKPASETPMTANLLVEVLLDAGLPPALVAVLHGGPDVGQALLESPVPDFYAFTGSTRTGEHIARTVGLRRTQLELGSLASTIVCADADLDKAAGLCVNAAYRKAGQVCTSIQRLYVARDVVHDFTARISDLLDGRKAGDPRQPDAFVGPLISRAAADRVHSWVEAAVGAGAELARGGTQTDSVIDPAVLTGVTREMRVMKEELFGPVVVLRTFDALHEAIDEVNDTPYGLAAGIFTNDLTSALDAADKLRVGTVHINESSSSRVDLMPFGGVKASGHGLEGPRYAIREMSEERLITIGRR